MLDGEKIKIDISGDLGLKKKEDIWDSPWCTFKRGQYCSCSCQHFSVEKILEKRILKDGLPSLIRGKVIVTLCMSVHEVSLGNFIDEYGLFLEKEEEEDD